MLKADHQRVSDLFAQYEAASDHATRRTAGCPVFTELETHAQLEETIFYPAVNEGTEAGPALVKDSVEAHETVKHLMEELQSMPHDTEAFDAKFQLSLSNTSAITSRKKNAPCFRWQRRNCQKTSTTCWPTCKR